MDPCDTKPNSKRERESDDDDDATSSSPPSKRQQPNQSKNPLKITDLNEICLEKIFRHLDLTSLFNVAIANEWLRPAAREIYQHRYGQSQSFISGRKFLTHTILQHFNSIDVHGLRPCLQYLRCFGPAIRDLWILYNKWTKQQCEHIHQYINEYCADTLTSILFQDKSYNYNPIKQFAKPFANVREVCTFDVDLGSQLSSFPTWFPNVSTLKLHSTRINRRCSIEVPFTHLRHLYLDISPSDGNGLTVNQATHLVSSNTQLNSLHLSVYGQPRLTPSALLNLIKNNQAITKLMVTLDESTVVIPAAHIERLVQEHPLLVEVSLKGFIFTAKHAITLTQRLNSLTCFCFEIKNTQDYDDCVRMLDQLWIVSRNQNTVSLTVRRG